MLHFLSIEHIKPEETVVLTCLSRSPGVSEIEVLQQGKKQISKESLRHKKSTLFCSDPPLQLNLCVSWFFNKCSLTKGGSRYPLNSST